MILKFKKRKLNYKFLLFRKIIQKLETKILQKMTIIESV